MAFKHWSGMADPPPVGEWVLLYRELDGYRQWWRFRDEAQRDEVIEAIDFTHWREEMTVDFP